SERVKALVRNRKQLRSIANALHAIGSQTGAYSISWSGSEGLRLDEGVPKLKSKEPVFTKLLQTLREAQRHRLFFLHDDRGGDRADQSPLPKNCPAGQRKPRAFRC